MARDALQFSTANPEATPGYTTAVTHLGELLARCDTLADQQKAGHAQVAAATAAKRDLQRVMKQGHLRHVVKVALVAAVEKPELAMTFVLPDRSASYLEFASTARTIAAEAAANRELLVKYGLSDAMLDGLTAAIARFEEAMEQGQAARQAHVTATAELEDVVAQMMMLVRVLDGLNRVRFAGDPEKLAAWRTATNIVTRTRKSGQPPAQGGEGVETAA